MPFLENLVEGLGAAADSPYAVGQIEQRKAKRAGLEHEELQAQTHSILEDVYGLQQRRAALDPKSPTYQQDIADVDANLHKARQAFTDLYHPEKNPGAMAKLGGFLKQHLAGRQPSPPPTTPGQARARMAETISGLDIAAAPRFQEQAAAGATLKPLPGSKPYKGQDGRWYQSMLRSDGTIQAAPMPENYEPPVGAVKPPKGLKFDPATDEVIDQDTATRYKRGDTNAPPEVQEMFKGQATAQAKKQELAERLAKVRGASYGAGRYVPVIDPNNPEAVTFMKAAEAAKTGAHSPASIGFQINKAVTRAFTSGPSAALINYFNTATNHLGLLRETVDALHNGNIQLFNKWSQRYAAETGSAAPNNFNTVRSAVSGELSKTFKGTGATDQEVALIEGTINTAQSPEQLAGAIGYYTSLMSGKMEALRGQFEAAKRGQPNFPTATPEELKEKARRSAGRAPAGTIQFQSGGRMYNIPATQRAEFLKDHPDATQVQ